MICGATVAVEAPWPERKGAAVSSPRNAPHFALLHHNVRSRRFVSPRSQIVGEVEPPAVNSSPDGTLFAAYPRGVCAR